MSQPEKVNPRTGLTDKELLAAMATARKYRVAGGETNLPEDAFAAFRTPCNEEYRLLLEEGRKERERTAGVSPARMPEIIATPPAVPPPVSRDTAGVSPASMPETVATPPPAPPPGAPSAPPPPDSATTRERQQLFVEALAECATVRGAARISGLDRRYAYRLKRRDPEFAAAWAAAENDAVDYLENIALYRADQGSDRLLMWILARRRPEKWGKNRENESGTAGVPPASMPGTIATPPAVPPPASHGTAGVPSASMPETIATPPAVPPPASLGTAGVSPASMPETIATPPAVPPPASLGTAGVSPASMPETIATPPAVPPPASLGTAGASPASMPGTIAAPPAVPPSRPSAFPPPPRPAAAPPIPTPPAVGNPYAPVGFRQNPPHGTPPRPFRPMFAVAVQSAISLLAALLLSGWVASSNALALAFWLPSAALAPAVVAVAVKSEIRNPQSEMFCFDLTRGDKCHPRFIGGMSIPSLARGDGKKGRGT